MRPPDINLVEMALENWFQRVRPYKRGDVLYWQGDPVENLFAIQQGAVRVSSVSTAGRIYSHGILGPGHLLGATGCFLDGA